jgi:hypothetical protein
LAPEPREEVATSRGRLQGHDAVVRPSNDETHVVIHKDSGDREKREK